MAAAPGGKGAVISAGPSTEVSIKTIVRFRPFNSKEKRKQEEYAKAGKYMPSAIHISEDNKTLTVPQVKPEFAKRPKSYYFDNCLPYSLDQSQAFDIIAQDTCKDLLNGYNGTIFMYGQTGSGKTYTMYGDESEPDNPSKQGIVPRSFYFVFDELETRLSNGIIKDFSVAVSFIEIYDRTVKDLLNSKNQPRFRLVHGREELIPLQKQLIASPSDGMKMVEIASSKRVVKATDQNATSSRSHMILRLEINVNTSDGIKNTGIGNFVDLAGSERSKKTKATGTTAREGVSINLSLSILGTCISALSKGQVATYRDHELTRLLRESLSGNCKTTVCIAASLHGFNREEVISALEFGKRCKSIKTRASKNVEMTPSQMKKKIKELQREIVRLKKEKGIIGGRPHSSKKKQSKSGKSGSDTSGGSSSDSSGGEIGRRSSTMIDLEIEPGESMFVGGLSEMESPADHHDYKGFEESKMNMDHHSESGHHFPFESSSMSMTLDSDLLMQLDQERSVVAKLEEELETLREEFNDLSKEKVLVEEAASSNLADIDSLTAQVEESTELIELKDEELQMKTKKCDEMTHALSDLEGRLESMQRRVDAAEAEKQRLDGERARLDGELKRRESEMWSKLTSAEHSAEEDRIRVGQLKQQMDEQNTIIDGTKRELESVCRVRDDLNESIQQLSKKNRDLEEKLIESKKEQERTDLERKEMEERVEDLENAEEILRKQVVEFEHEKSVSMRKFEEELDESREKESKLREKLNDVEQTMESLQLHMKEHKKMYRDLKATLNITQSNLRSLEKELQSVKKELDEKKDEVSRLLESEEQSKKVRMKLEEENAELKAQDEIRRTEEEKRQQSLVERLRDVQASSEASKAQVSASLVEAEQKIQEHSADLKSSRLESARWKGTATELRTQLEKTTLEKDEALAEVSRLRKMLDELRTRVESEKALKKSAESERDDLFDQNQDLSSKLEQSVTMVKQLQSEMSEMKEKVRKTGESAKLEQSSRIRSESEIRRMAEKNEYLRKWMQKKREQMYKEDEEMALRIQREALERAAKKAGHSDADRMDDERLTQVALSALEKEKKILEKKAEEERVLDELEYQGTDEFDDMF